MDRETDTTNLIVAFRNFGNAPKNFHLVQEMARLGCTKGNNAPLGFIKGVAFLEQLKSN